MKNRQQRRHPSGNGTEPPEAPKCQYPPCENPAVAGKDSMCQVHLDAAFFIGYALSFVMVDSVPPSGKARTAIDLLMSVFQRDRSGLTGPDGRAL